jgi:hypothetical protein
MTTADWIALQVRVDEQDRLLRASGHREGAEVMQALRVFAYAQWEANRRAMTALQGAPAMETER